MKDSVRKHYCNIVNKEPTRLVLFSLILDKNTSEDELLKINYKNTLYNDLSDVDGKYDPADLFPKNSMQIKIDREDRFKVVGNKQSFTRGLDNVKAVFDFSAFDWAMRIFHSDISPYEELLGLSDFKRKYGADGYFDYFMDDYSTYIKEYYMKQTNKKQFSKTDLNKITAGLLCLFIDMSGFILSLDVVDEEYESVKDPRLVQAKLDLQTKIGLPFDNIIPFSQSNRIISLQPIENNRYPYLYQAFIEGMQVLYKKFNGNLFQLEHILRVGYERFIVFTHEQSTYPEDYDVLLNRFDESIQNYNLLVGVRILTADGIITSKEFQNAENSTSI